MVNKTTSNTTHHRRKAGSAEKLQMGDLVLALTALFPPAFFICSCLLFAAGMLRVKHAQL